MKIHVCMYKYTHVTTIFAKRVYEGWEGGNRKEKLCKSIIISKNRNNK